VSEPLTLPRRAGGLALIILIALIFGNKKSVMQGSCMTGVDEAFFGFWLF
jgi:hypothetical protein